MKPSAQRLASLAGILVLCAACSKQTTPYKTAMTAAEEARRDGRFEQERHHFGQAAEEARKPKDAGEARYRAAESYVREGNFERGAQELEKFARAYPRAIRAARAWLDAGRAWERAEQRELALAAFSVVLTEYPESGNAIAAAKRIVALRSADSAEQSAEQWRTLLKKNKSAILDEALRYHYAKALERTSLRNAIVTYEDVAKRHPLPHGSYTDEALLRAAELRRQEGDSEGALLTISLLLEQGGRAAFVGSYTRTAYIEGLLLRGKILRDDLQRLDDALAAFRLLPDRYPHSRLIDDALWEAVITEQMLGQSGCNSMKRLKKRAPESRFLRCERLVCAEGEPSDERQLKKCQEWLRP